MNHSQTKSSSRKLFFSDKIYLDWTLLLGRVRIFSPGSVEQLSSTIRSGLEHLEDIREGLTRRSKISGWFKILETFEWVLSLSDLSGVSSRPRLEKELKDVETPKGLVWRSGFFVCLPSQLLQSKLETR